MNKFINKLVVINRSFLIFASICFFSGSLFAIVPFWESYPEVDNIKDQWFFSSENVLVKKIPVMSVDSTIKRHCYFCKKADGSVFIREQDFLSISEEQKRSGFKYSNGGVEIDFYREAEYSYKERRYVYSNKVDKKLTNSVAVTENIGVSIQLKDEVDPDAYIEAIVNERWIKVSGLIVPTVRREVIKNGSLVNDPHSTKFEMVAYVGDSQKNLVSSFFSINFKVSPGNIYKSIRNDMLYKMPFNNVLRPLMLAGNICLQGMAFKKFIYDWFLSRPANYLFGEYFTKFQVYQKVSGMVEVPKYKDVTYGKELDSLINDFAEKMEKKRQIECKGLILHGKPGNGKTVLLHQLAHRSNAIFINVKALNLQVPIAGRDKAFSIQKSLEALFWIAGMYRRFYDRPVMIFWDELDNFFGKRLDISDQFSSSIVNTLLDQINDLDVEGGVYFCGATNHLGAMEEAMLRPGRAGRLIEIKDPSLCEIEDLVSKFVKNNKKELPKYQAQMIAFFANNCVGLSRAAIADALSNFIKNVGYALEDNKVSSLNEEELKKMATHCIDIIKENKNTIASL